MLFRITLLAAIFVTVQGPVQAETVWSFERHPIIIDVERPDLFGEPVEMGEKCSNRLNVHFEMYNRIYPGFRALGSKEHRQRLWKTEIAETGTPRLALCLGYNIWWNFLDTSHAKLRAREKHPFVYTGRFCWSENTVNDVAMQKAIADIIRYSKNSHWFVLMGFFDHTKDSRYFDLNPDIEYYFRMRNRISRGPDEDDAEINHLRDQLSEHQRRFIEKAAKNGNFEAVAERTAPCTLRT